METLYDIGILEREKEIIIKTKLKELGIELDLRAEATKRFKSFLLEKSFNKETYYYNDGSNEGLRIITFEKSGIEDFPKIKDYSVCFSYKYY